MNRSPDQWPELLSHAAEHMRTSALPLPPTPRQPSRIDAVTPFLLHRKAVQPAETIGPPAQPALDAALWWSLAGTSVDLALAIEAAAPPAAGALLNRDAYDTVEVWTEAELCALQALWWLAQRHRREDWRDRVMTAARWHIDHTQPDNATNRPWAIAPFAHLAVRESNDEAGYYAQTLLHNAAAGPARATVLLVEIVADAADALRAITFR